MPVDPKARDLLNAAMDAQGFTDNEMRAALAAVTMGESKMLGFVEVGYSHTNNKRIRDVFGDRVPADDAELNALKASDEAFFEHVYGGNTRTAHQLGNTQPGDGYKFRGRYPGQITGRSNYTLYATKSKHPELLDNPDLGIENPAVGMAVTVAYAADRYKGGGIDGMLHAFGNNTDDIERTKRAYFAEFTESGEFNAGATVQAGTAATTAPAGGGGGIAASHEGGQHPPLSGDDPVPAAIGALQTALQARGFNPGPIDTLWGRRTQGALDAYNNQRHHG